MLIRFGNILIRFFEKIIIIICIFCTTWVSIGAAAWFPKCLSLSANHSRELWPDRSMTYDCAQTACCMSRSTRAYLPRTNHARTAPTASGIGTTDSWPALQELWCGGMPWSRYTSWMVMFGLRVDQRVRWWSCIEHTLFSFEKGYFWIVFVIISAHEVQKGSWGISQLDK